MASDSTQPDGTPINSTTQPSNTSVDTPISTAVTTLGPDDVFLTMKYINDDSWPSDFNLDIGLDNWDEWSLQISLLAMRQGFAKWLDGTLAQPDAVMNARAHRIWANNDCSLRAFILSHVSKNDYWSVSHLSTSHAVFEELRKTHEKKGRHAQMMLILKALNIRYRPGVPLSKTAREIDALHSRIVKMGPIDDDQLLSVLLLHALIDNYPDMYFHLTFISENDPTFSSKTIIRRIHQEHDLIRLRAEQNPQASAARAQVRQRGSKPRPVCTNCEKLGHLVDYCIKPGGKMAGRSIDDARSAQRAAVNTHL